MGLIQNPRSKARVYQRKAKHRPEKSLHFMSLSPPGSFRGQGFWKWTCHAARGRNIVEIQLWKGGELIVCFGRVYAQAW